MDENRSQCPQPAEEAVSPQAPSPWPRRIWHGAVKAVTVLCTLGLCWALAYFTRRKALPVYDAILLGETLLAFAVAVVCSHAYNYYPESKDTRSLREKAAKQKSVWLHANFSWEVISVWMTVTPLYCTCATIYISGSTPTGGWSQVQLHVLVYSILSLVLSLGTYVLRPSYRAAGYRKAHLCVSEALARSSADDPLADAIAAGEKCIAQQDVLGPQ